MKAAIYGVCTFALLSLAPSAALAQTKAAPSDRTLDSRIESRIHHDAVLKHYDVDVSVDSAVAKLTGTVPSEKARKKATTLATIPGITRVNNDLIVDPHVHMRGTTGTISEKTQKAGEKTAGAVSKTGEVITDTWITTRVKSKYIDESSLKGSDVHVETTNHVVTLTGTVPTEAARARAIEQAKEVDGVHHVVDHLAIGPKK